MDYSTLRNFPVVLTPLTLESATIRLEPLALSHWADLCEAGADPAIWTWYPFAMGTPAQMRDFIETALTQQEQGIALPFAVIDRASGRAIGSTRFGNVERIHHRAEIGWTWYTPAWQRTAANTEAKYLLLTHAFETLRLVRVEFKTDSLNMASRTALARIGAVEEGVLRNHMITSTGRLRHSVFFSITDTEWANVKTRLAARLAPLI
jgi:RimJ/RimL family protein N-acetyltransferase